jgi:hypothetical protein
MRRETNHKYLVVKDLEASSSGSLLQSSRKKFVSCGIANNLASIRKVNLRVQV